MKALLELKNIGRHYPSGEQQVAVLKGINLSIYAGEMVAIIGASGSGKSTLMNILGCLDQPDSGEYWISGQPIAQCDDDSLARLRREYFGFIFQRYHLLPHLSAQNNVAIPAIYAGSPKLSRQQRAQALLQRLGLSDRLHYLPAQLSGGQQQRVSICRALMNGGKVILADEPTGALDRESGREVMTILKQLTRQGHTVVIVTHDPEIAAQAERVIELRDGEIIAEKRSQPLPKQEPLAEELPNISVPYWRQMAGQFIEAFVMAWLALITNKMRTALTMLGIVIGIASVVSILVIGDAAKQSVLTDIRSIGTSTIDIYPGKDLADDDPVSRRALTQRDEEALVKQPYIMAVSPVVSTNQRLRFGNVDVSVNILGVNEQFIDVYAMKVVSGSGISAEQIKTQAQVMVIDTNAQKRLFPQKKEVIGQTVLLGNVSVMIIGVVQSNSMLFGGNTLQVFLPYTMVGQRILGQSWYSSIAARIKDGYNSAEAEQQIERLLLLLHGKKDFNLLNLDTMVRAAEKVTRSLQTFLTLVAVISLVVGGIGVMNIMLVSVTERTREIGIRMAVGARSSDVRQQFLIEAILVCLLGGSVGVLLSLMIGFSATLFLPQWQINFPPLALFSAFICSTAIGILFGYLPASKAARLTPIEALARE